MNFISFKNKVHHRIKYIFQNMDFIVLNRYLQGFKRFRNKVQIFSLIFWLFFYQNIFISFKNTTSYTHSYNTVQSVPPRHIFYHP